MIKQLIAGLVVVAAFIMVLTPKIRSTCMLLLCFICVCWYVFSQCFIGWLKEVRRKIRTTVKTVLFTEGREWLDETEQQITE